VFASRARLKSREIDSISSAGRFDSTHIAVPDRWAQAPGGLPHSIDAFRSRESRTSIIFRRFLPWLGRPPTERRSSRPAPAAMGASPVVSIIGAKSSRCGFGGLAFDSVREKRVDRRRPLVAVRTPTMAVSTETIRKYRMKTVPCREISITGACYLCNTLRKRGGPKPLEAVP